MKFDFEPLSAEPLFYLLMHSGAFVCVLGFIFSIVGLLFGYATWGRYKGQTRTLRAEAEAMKEEIADLKRKIAGHTVKPGPVVAMATETIYMPKKDEAAAPALKGSTASPAPAAAPPAAEAPAPPGKPSLITPKAPLQPPPPEEPEPAKAAPESAPAAVSMSGPAPAAVTPPVPAQPPEHHESPLAAIIAAPHVAHEAEAALAQKEPADSIPTLVELSVSPLPELEIKPEADPRLGLIYRTRPEKVDDLTALKGVSQRLAQRLNEHGIYSYEQIAAWNEDHIREFSSRLAFKDRIQREHWVEQAARLAAAGKKAA